MSSWGARSGEGLLGDRFRIVEEIGSGAYGKVFKAYDLRDRQIVALKTFKSFDPKIGLPIAIFREKKALSIFHHKNIVNFGGMFLDKQTRQLFYVMECCDTDLGKQLEASSCLTTSQIKSLMYQLLCGLNEIHSHGYAHRDIKPANLLIKGGIILKISDFGLSRELNSNKLTSCVVSRAYRAPELIFGSTSYSTSIDIWSAGVIFYELVTGEKFPAGQTDIAQLDNIFKICGSPNEETSTLKELPHWRRALLLMLHERKLEDILESKVPSYLHDAIPIISSMLSLEPNQRPSAKQLLEDPFFENIGNPEPLLYPQLSEESSATTSPMSFMISRPPPILIKV